MLATGRRGRQPDSPSDIHDRRGDGARRDLSLELATPCAGIRGACLHGLARDRGHLRVTYICKDGSRFPAIVSITALRDDYGDIIGILLIGPTIPSQAGRVGTTEAMDAAEKANRAKSDFLSG